jgi:hypothetical protein
MPAIAWNTNPEGPFAGCSRKQRHRWRPLELVAMIAGFVLFWPVGLAVLGWKLNWFGFGTWFDAKFGTDRRAAGERAAWGCSRHDRGPDHDPSRDSGNSAFEAWKEGEFARLQAEYEALSQRQREFEAFLQHLREAKDREEFERFMKDRQTQDRAAAPGKSDEGAAR